MIGRVVAALSLSSDPSSAFQSSHPAPQYNFKTEYYSQGVQTVLIPRMMPFRQLRRLLKERVGYTYDELAMPNFEIRIAHLQPGRLKDKLCVTFETFLINVS
jgi:hypothetical protein